MMVSARKKLQKALFNTHTTIPIGTFEREEVGTYESERVAEHMRWRKWETVRGNIKIHLTAGI